MSVKTYMVTGASTGIGRACVDQLARAGARVWATARTDRDCKALEREYPDTVTALHMDLTDPDSIVAAGERVRDAGALDGLVNNAGVALPAPLEYIPLDAFRRQIEVNLTGQLAVTQAVLPALRQARRQGAPARIVLVGSIGGRIAAPMLGPYHASKFGLVGLTDALRAELAPAGIRVVLIEPGAVDTPIWDRGAAAAAELADRLPAAAQEHYAAQIAAARTAAARSAQHGLPPHRAAQLIVKALTSSNPRPRYLLGRDAHLGALVAKLPFRLRYQLTAARH